MAGEERTYRFYLLRYMPDLVRGEFINIGVLLHDPTGKGLYPPRLLQDFRRVRRLHPWADLAVLAGLQKQIEAEAAAPEDVTGCLNRLEQSCNVVQITEPKAVLTGDPEAELDRLYETYVREPRYSTRLGAAVERSRAWIRSQLTAALRRAGLWQKLERAIPVAEFTHAGDPFKFDFGYRHNAHRGFLHVLALERETNRAKVLAYTMEHIHVRLSAQKLQASCTAVVEGLPAPGNEAAQLGARILQEQEIALVPVGGLERFTTELARELV